MTSQEDNDWTSPWPRSSAQERYLAMAKGKSKPKSEKGAKKTATKKTTKKADK